ncbi:MAG: hypothetical protein MJY90_02345 [Bacteroidaceae bacterium]|nr:hypothetical protein [Bacteroidaceae bacterium]
MATIDDEILLGAEEDAKEVEYIMNYLPQDVKEKFCEDDIYYCIDVILDYFMSAKSDDEGYYDVDLDEITDIVIKKAKQEKIGEWEHDDVFFIVQAELDYNEQCDD